MAEKEKNEHWERSTLENLLFSTLKEQRSRRRWGTFFKLLILTYVVATTYYLVVSYHGSPFSSESSYGRKHTALISINGEISSRSSASAAKVNTSLRRAFRSKNTQGIILSINSPGGSPVQSAYIYNEIKYQRKEHPKIKVYAVCSDACASGAYYIAAAADEIYANRSSLVGSIGVLINSFGFVDSMQKVGVVRRMLKSGKYKGSLDPFSPMQPFEKQHIQAMLDEVHQQFINDVKKGRGDRLQDDPDLFTGLIWTGEEAKKLGLVDGFGSASYVAREVIKEKHITNYTIRKSTWERLANRFGVAVGAAMGDTLAKLATESNSSIKAVAG